MDAVIDFLSISRGRPAAVLATMLLAVGACAPDPERLRAQRTIEAEYQRETGRLELITFDSDDNGTVDTWSCMEGKQVLRIEIDRDEDGTIDRWEYYREDRPWRRSDSRVETTASWTPGRSRARTARWSGSRSPR